MHIQIHAPKEFRPSNWVDMLKDIDVAFDLDPHLVEPCLMRINDETHCVLTVMCSLLNLESPRLEVREALFQEMIAKASTIGLKVTVPSDFVDIYPRWWSWLEAYCLRKGTDLSVDSFSASA